MSEEKENADVYEKMYKEGYGLNYPDGHVIRFHLKVLVNQFGITKGKVFDYGCGSGIHMKYFADNGFTPFGCDTSKKAIEECRKLMPEFKDSFHCTNPTPILEDYFGQQLKDVDLIFSNETLYFLNDTEIKKLVNQFYDIAKESAVFFATMKPRECYFGKFVESEHGDMSKVVLKGRHNNTTLFVNFKNRQECEQIFKPFTKHYIGSYSTDLRADEGLGNYHIYIGTKKEAEK